MSKFRSLRLLTVFIALLSFTTAYGDTPYYWKLITAGGTNYVSGLILSSNDVSSLTFTNIGSDRVARIGLVTFSNSTTVTWSLLSNGVWQATSTGSGGTSTNLWNAAITNAAGPGITMGVNGFTFSTNGWSFGSTYDNTAYSNFVNNTYLPIVGTNGLATQLYVTSQGFVTQTVTNGLVGSVVGPGFTTVGGGVTFSTNGWSFYENSTYSNFVASTYLPIIGTNGLATQLYVTSQGYVTQSITNGLASQAWVGQQGYRTTDSNAVVAVGSGCTIVPTTNGTVVTYTLTVPPSGTDSNTVNALIAAGTALNASNWLGWASASNWLHTVFLSINGTSTVAQTALAGWPTQWDWLSITNKSGVLTNGYSAETIINGLRIEVTPGSFSNLRPTTNNPTLLLNDASGNAGIAIGAQMRLICGAASQAIASFLDVFRVGPDSGTNLDVYATLTNHTAQIASKMPTNGIITFAQLPTGMATNITGGGTWSLSNGAYTFTPTGITTAAQSALDGKLNTNAISIVQTTNSAGVASVSGGQISIGTNLPPSGASGGGITNLTLVLLARSADILIGSTASPDYPYAKGIVFAASTDTAHFDVNFPRYYTLTGQTSQVRSHWWIPNAATATQLVEVGFLLLAGQNPTNPAAPTLLCTNVVVGSGTSNNFYWTSAVNVPLIFTNDTAVIMRLRQISGNTGICTRVEIIP